MLNSKYLVKVAVMLYYVAFEHVNSELEEDIIVFTNKPPYLLSTVVNKNGYT